VFEISIVAVPSHSGSNGVTLTITPQRAYVDFPRQIVRTSRGILKYSTVLASTKEFGGMEHTSARRSANNPGSKCLGSMAAALAPVNTLISAATRMS
jgi:hypothetical protein